MIQQLDSSYILYGLGAFLGIVSVLYFGQEVLLSLSPTVKSLLLFIGFVFFLVSGIRTNQSTFGTVLILLAGGTYLIFLGYTIFRFHPTTNQIFLSLAASSTLLIGIGYALHEKQYTLTPQYGRYILIGCAVLAALLVTIDVMSPQATVTTQFEDAANLSAAEDGKIQLGTVHVENPFMFSRFAMLPHYTSCFVTANESARIESRTGIGDRLRGDVMLDGKETRTEPITAQFPITNRHPDRPGLPLDNRSLGTVPIVQAEDGCPEVAEQPVIAVTEMRPRN